MSDPFNINTYCAQLAAATCARQARCDPQALSFYYDTQASCQTYHTDACVNGDNGRKAALIGHTVGYHAAAFTACTQSYASTACDQEVGLGAPCDGVLTGTLGAGASCFSGAQCNAGLHCFIPTGMTCGTCQADKAAGAPCATGEVCVDGYYCYSGSCQAESVLFAHAGQTCSTTAVPVCAGEGGRCNATTTVCEYPVTMAAGAACMSNDAINQCPLGQVCKAVDSTHFNGTCTAKPILGQACDWNTNFLFCTGGTFCTALELTTSGGTCVARRGVNGACSNANLYTPSDLSFMVCDVTLDCWDTNGDTMPAGNTCLPPPMGPVPPVCP